MTGLSVRVTDNNPKAIPWDLNGDLGGEITYKQLGRLTQNALIDISKEVLAEEQAKGFDKNPRERTDNVWDRPAEDVKPFGKIEYFSSINIATALVDAYKLILERSVIGKTRTFYSSHIVIYESVIVAENLRQLEKWVKNGAQFLKEGSTIKIVNTTPYAARLEWNGYRRGVRGKYRDKNIKRPRSGKRSSSSKASKSKQIVKVPNGVYHIAGRAIRRKYKAGLDVRPTFIKNGDFGINISGGGFRSSYIANSPTGRSGPYVYPIILFKIRSAGVA
jgi:hypothetical protein